MCASSFLFFLSLRLCTNEPRHTRLSFLSHQVSASKRIAQPGPSWPGASPPPPPNPPGLPRDATAGSQCRCLRLVSALAAEQVPVLPSLASTGDALRKIGGRGAGGREAEDRDQVPEERGPTAVGGDAGANEDGVVGTASSGDGGADVRAPVGAPAVEVEVITCASGSGPTSSRIPRHTVAARRSSRIAAGYKCGGVVTRRHSPPADTPALILGACARGVVWGSAGASDGERGGTGMRVECMS